MEPKSRPDPLRRGLLLTSLAAGMAPLFVRHARGAEVEPRFALGVASGCPRPDTLVLWTRLVGAALPDQVEVRWELAEDERFERIAARGVERAVAADAHSVHAEPARLAPERWYWYRFTALGQRSAVGRTRSAPAPGAAAPRLRFAIASCQRWDHGLYTAWGDMARQDLDLVLFLGDYIYEYATPANSDRPRRHQGGHCRTLDDYRRRYAQYKSDAQLQAMHAAAPWIVTWDDHEIDNDWAANVSQELEPQFELRRAAATQAYWEHMPFPKAARPQGFRIRLNERYDWGRLARIITVDDRQFRSQQVCPKPGRAGSNTVALADCPDFLDPQRSLLGGQQEQWLAQSWDASRAWNLLGQQTLMATLNWEARPERSPRFWTDGWDGYPAARTRLLRELAERRVPNAVVLGGDVHANYVADLKLDFADPDAAVLATEFCGTSISSEGLAQSRLDAALPHNPHLRYGRADQRGYMRFELREQRLEAELRSVRAIWDPASPVDVAARFAVEAGRAGAQPA
ncbi:alkaline phosphatase D family protein [Roseateles violae]|uniref:Alkaline phosphatase D family protein n=1 Tax=Roseateles violae TaxID=3058042 RepID=A0ABT8DNR8_9BURK|nr:alkaline phosphatase D family protein [Pelomonas sp. PFR6]MDN3919641.1 alkaline phosphatase D family protein [Pelomonas sp. PFR6]